MLTVNIFYGTILEDNTHINMFTYTPDKFVSKNLVRILKVRDNNLYLPCIRNIKTLKSFTVCL